MGYKLDPALDVIIDNPKPLGIKSSFGNTGIFTINYTNVNQARDNFKNLLLTKPGERYNHPTFGCNLLNLLFQQMTDSLTEQIQSTIQDAVSFWLPYIVIDNIDVQLNSSEIIPDHTLKISITYSLFGAIEPDTIIIFAGESGILKVE